ncbi:hypothetical protein [Streptomyces lincolnensis]
MPPLILYVDPAGNTTIVKLGLVSESAERVLMAADHSMEPARRQNRLS